MQAFTLSLADLTRLSATIRRQGDDASSLETVAQRVTSILYRSLTHPEMGQTACNLVRCFVTERLHNLPKTLRTAAERVAGDPLDAYTRCLVLLGTAGDQKAWNARTDSQRHQAIPLVSREAVERLPMVRELFVKLGVGTDALVDPSRSLLVDAEGEDFGVFCVPHAEGSPFIPDQSDFVSRYGVRSVVGFGCQIPSGEVVAIVSFWKFPLNPTSAPLFRTLALALKVAAVSGGYARVFEMPSSPADDSERPIHEFDLRHLHSLSRAKRALLAVHESTVEEQAQRLEDSLLDVRAAREDLQDRVDELARKRCELEQRNEELDQFTYVASHDLQEPLRKLIAYSELLSMDAGEALPAEARTDLDFIVDAATRMQTLVQDLLALSRTSRKQIEPRRVDLDVCITEVLESLGLALDEAGAQVLRDRVPERIWAEPALLRHVYLNLISNAIKFRSPGRPLTIRLTCKAEAGSYVLGVRDNGLGIPERYHEHVFAPFRRLHTKEEIEGTGIGLAICRAAVERLGGEIGVRSEEGVGSLFWFRLPRPPDRAEEKEIVES
jgi:signal transduction histidine kinase